MKRLLLIGVFTVAGVFVGTFVVGAVVALVFPPPKPSRDTDSQYNTRVAIALAGVVLGGITGFALGDIAVRRLKIK